MKLLKSLLLLLEKTGYVKSLKMKMILFRFYLKIGTENAKILKTENKFSEKVNAYIQMASLINLNCNKTVVSAGLENKNTQIVIKEDKDLKD